MHAAIEFCLFGHQLLRHHFGLWHTPAHGNPHMHGPANLSFVAEHGRPYNIAPAYDMTPMALAPRTGGGIPDIIAEASIHGSVANETWRRAEELARTFLTRVKAATGFSPYHYTQLPSEF
jgi:hypothetical protein